MACTLAAYGWLAFTLLGGKLGERIGRVRRFQIGYVLMALWSIPMWFLIDSKDIVLFLRRRLRADAAARPVVRPAGRAVRRDVPGQGALFGRLGGLRARLGPRRRVRGDIARWIVSTTGQSWVVGVYMVVLSLISAAAVSVIRDPMSVDLNVKEEPDA